MRCKPGDLAVVVDAFNRTNLGRIVKVIRLHDGKGVLAMAGSREVWLVHCAQPLTWTEGTKRYRRKNGPAPDAQLQPIRGDKLGSVVGDAWRLPGVLASQESGADLSVLTDDLVDAN